MPETNTTLLITYTPIIYTQIKNCKLIDQEWLLLHTHTTILLFSVYLSEAEF